MNADLHELDAAYALDALSPEERERFEQHLAECPRCQAEVAGLLAAAAQLGAAVAQPPPAGLRGAVLERVATTQQAAAPNKVTLLSERRRGPAVWLAAAAAALVLAVGGGVVVWQQQNVNQLTARQQEIAAVLNAPDAVTRQDPHVGPRGRMTVVASRRADAAVVLVADLPPLPSDRNYQLWLVTPAKPLSAGTVPAKDTTATVVVNHLHGAKAVAVTVEPAGGSSQPTSPIISVAKLA